jgi:hypothetical protein
MMDPVNDLLAVHLDSVDGRSFGESRPGRGAHGPCFPCHAAEIVHHERGGATRQILRHPEESQHSRPTKCGVISKREEFQCI